MPGNVSKLTVACSLIQNSKEVRSNDEIVEGWRGGILGGVCEAGRRVGLHCFQAPIDLI